MIECPVCGNIRLDLCGAPSKCPRKPLATSPAVEIRRNPDQSIDEICIDGGSVHIEQMDDSGWYMGVEARDGSYWQFWFGAKNRKSHVEFRHTETTPAVTNGTRESPTPTGSVT